jgi:hypothetical protein
MHKRSVLNALYYYNIDIINKYSLSSSYRVPQVKALRIKFFLKKYISYFNLFANHTQSSETAMLKIFWLMLITFGVSPKIECKDNEIFFCIDMIKKPEIDFFLWNHDICLYMEFYDIMFDDAGSVHKCLKTENNLEYYVPVNFANFGEYNLSLEKILGVTNMKDLSYEINVKLKAH